MSIEQHTYEFSVYNSEVRKLLEIGETHRQLDDGWAEQRYIQISGKNETIAKEKLSRRYPENKGYVYASVIKFID
ncbi:MAG: hypothetical protein HOH19_03930 [Kordiimonadaceae bacterium]|jgi:hypothetical protein|nr:hypothetical protein [Kordiimonadaceae bacterium]MBT6031701.1 hypothetical protein [Kordiimonadaceae bacterium]